MGAESDQGAGVRPVRGSERVRALNGFRAFAIFGVVAIHLIGVSGFFIAHPDSEASVVIWSIFGNTIDAFFIISGFVLFLPVIRRGGEFGDKWAFWVGRGARLLPAFWLVLAVLIVLTAVKPPGPGLPVPDRARARRPHPGHAAARSQLFDSGFRIGFGINGPLWMISIVVRFYAAAAVHRPGLVPPSADRPGGRGGDRRSPGRRRSSRLPGSSRRSRAARPRVRPARSPSTSSRAGPSRSDSG